MEEDHQILGAGGPMGQCSRKLISNPATSFQTDFIDYHKLIRVGKHHEHGMARVSCLAAITQNV